MLAIGVLTVAATTAAAPSATHAEVSSRRVIYLPIAGPAPRAVAAPRFGAGRGFYERPFMLVIRSDTAGAVIRYTLDGRVPSPVGGVAYVAPILITTTSVVRAMAYRPGYVPSEVATQTFIFARDVLRQPEAPPGFPMTWGIPPEEPSLGPMPADYGMDPDVVLDPRYRDALPGDLLALPSVSVVTAPEDLFGVEMGLYSHPDQRGMDWERPASVELIDPEGEAGFQVDCGIRIAGVASRKHGHTLKKSFSLRFRSRYGVARLHYPLFPGGGVMSFDALRLRAGFNDSFPYLPGRAQYIRDQWGRDTQRAMGWSAARGRFVHLYLNGLYWGLYNLTEEPAAAFAADHLGGKEEDYDVVESNARGEPGVIDGDRVAYEQLRALEHLEDPAQYARAAVLLNIPQHIDFLLIEIFGANQDWPLNNWRAARSRVIGGGFQFFVWDYEMAHDLLPPGHLLYDLRRADNMASTPGVDNLHAKLLANPEYRLAFADRVQRHFASGGALSPERSRARYADLAEQIERAIVAESARWGDGPVGRFALSDGGQVWPSYWAAFGPGHAQTRDDEWAPERDRLLNAWFPGRTATVMAQLCPLVLFPPVAAPEIDPPGGLIESGIKLVMRGGTFGCPGARSDGAIYYTSDGSDPREPSTGKPDRPWSGRIAPLARLYRGPITLPGPRQIKARAALVDNGELVWSALAEASFGAPRLAWTEIMYHPPDPDAEFLELANLGTAPADLTGMTLDGVSYTFPPGVSLAPGAYAVLVKDPAAFRREHVGVPIDGVYGGRLANEGETVALRDRLGQVQALVDYDDEGYWPLGPDGEGWSLVPADPAATSPGQPPAPDDPDAWRASVAPGGSPGAADPPPTHGRVLLSELLAASDPPFEDAIELFNPGPEPVTIGGWFLSDNRDDLRKFRIPDGTVIQPGGFAVFYENELRIGLPLNTQVADPQGPPPGERGRPARKDLGQPSSLTGETPALPRGMPLDIGLPQNALESESPVASPNSTLPWIAAHPADFGTGFALSADGEAVYLSAADRVGGLTGFIHGLRFGASPSGISIGRVVTRGGPDFVALEAPTFGVAEPGSVEAFRIGRGAPNARPRIGAAVISEIMYHPAEGDDEYIELHNRLATALALFEPGEGDGPGAGWRFTAGVDYAFPAGSAIPAGGFALVVPIDPELFRIKHRIPRDVPIFGPYAGHLDNAGETLALARPAGTSGDPPPAIEVDRIRYDDQPPWRPAADGGGPALERIAAGRFGNDPDNWAALKIGGTPGLANSGVTWAFLPVVRRGR